jgi:UrcA family protein
MNIKVHTHVLRRLFVGGLGALICCTALASAASATSARERRSVTVFYGDLNLSNPVGVKRLYLRIRRAAFEVCEAPTGLTPPSLKQAARRCVNEAIDGAVRSIDNGTLTALHQDKTQRRVS